MLILKCYLHITGKVIGPLFFPLQICVVSTLSVLWEWLYNMKFESSSFLKYFHFLMMYPSPSLSTILHASIISSFFHLLDKQDMLWVVVTSHKYADFANWHTLSVDHIQLVTNVSQLPSGGYWHTNLFPLSSCYVLFSISYRFNIFSLLPELKLDKLDNCSSSVKAETGWWIDILQDVSLSQAVVT